MSKRSRWALAAGLGLALAALAASPADVRAQTLSASAQAQIEALLEAKSRRTALEDKLDTPLWIELLRRRNDPVLDAMPRLRTAPPFDPDGRLRVEVRGHDGTRARERLDRIDARMRGLGGLVTARDARRARLAGRLSFAAIRTLMASPDVRAIRLADPATTHAVVSQGDVAHRADLARGGFATDGSGVLICALSDGVGELTSLQASGELPAVTVLPGEAGDPGDTEGTAMLEIVHDLAPGADLAFATAFGGQSRFASNIDGLAELGCDVIVDDVIYLTEPVFQDGPIAEAVESAVADGVVYVSAAGNFGNLDDGSTGVFEGDFVPGSRGFQGGRLHDFGGGLEYDRISLDPQIAITLQWADPWDASDNDYDLFLLDPTGQDVVDASAITQNGNDDPIELILADGRNEWDHRLVVVLDRGDPRYLHLNTHGGRLDVGTDGQIYGHPAAAGAIATAAVRTSLAGGGAFADDPSALDVETFSSDGPRRVFFDDEGDPITPGDFSSTGGAVRPKPDVTAASNVFTTTPGFTRFVGTSASAPHVAAIAGLMLDTRPVYEPAQIHDALIATAIDIEAPGFDRNAGHGVVDAFDALQAVAPELVPGLGPAGLLGVASALAVIGWRRSRASR